MKNLLKTFILLFCLNSFAQNGMFSYTTEKEIIKVKPNESANLKITDWIVNVPTDKKLDNKFIVLNLWKTGASEEHFKHFQIDHLNELQGKFGSKNLYFISLANEKPEALKKEVKKWNFKAIVASDQRKINAFWTGGIDKISYPLTLLIDNYGTVKWIGIPQHLTKKILQEFLAGTLEPYDMYMKIRKKK
ncbi:hypothetical protein [Flavobacterium pedocola]